MAVNWHNNKIKHLSQSQSQLQRRNSTQKRWTIKGAIVGSFLLTLLIAACDTTSPEAADPGAVEEPVAEEVQPNVEPEEDTEVQVTGEVRQFVVAEVEQDLGLELEDDLYVDFVDRPAIIAQSMAPAPDPGAITEEPAQYYGERLAVKGEVADIVAPNIFTLNDEELFAGEDLLVLYPTPKELVEEDQSVAVTGELRAFVVAELERDYDLGWDPGVVEELEAEFTDKPVLVADTVYQSAISE